MVELLRFRDLIWALVVRDLKVRYRRSVLGFMWSMLQPLLMLAVFQLVFSTIFRFNVDNYPVYALAGIVFWNFFSQSIICSMNSLRAHAYILQKVPVPLAIFPVTTVISGLVNLFFALIPMSVILAVTGHHFSSTLVFLPVAILVTALFTLGAGLLLSPLAVFFTDVVELVGVVLTLLFYLTPCFYPTSAVEEHSFYWVIEGNPVRFILEVFRYPIYHGELPPTNYVLWALAATALVLVAGTWVFQKSSRRIPFFV